MTLNLITASLLMHVIIFTWIQKFACLSNTMKLNSTSWTQVWICMSKYDEEKDTNRAFNTASTFYARNFRPQVSLPDNISLSKTQGSIQLWWLMMFLLVTMGCQSTAKIETTPISLNSLNLQYVGYILRWDFAFLTQSFIVVQRKSIFILLKRHFCRQPGDPH